MQANATGDVLAARSYAVNATEALHVQLKCIVRFTTSFQHMWMEWMDSGINHKLKYSFKLLVRHGRAKRKQMRATNVDRMDLEEVGRKTP